VLAYGELWIVLRREVNFDREEKAAAIECLATATLKITPLQAWRGTEVSRRLRLPDFKTIGT
jgi:hypothetical protein